MNTTIAREKMNLIQRVLRSMMLTGLGTVLGILLGVLVLQIVFAATGRSTGNTNVAIAGFAYSPKQAVVRVGDTVTWTNNDSAPHTVTANDASFDSGTLGQGGVYSRTFGATGVFSYFCAIHPSMVGSVRVISEALVHLPLVVRAGQASAPPAPPGPPVVGEGGRWSDPATWGGTLPGPNTEVTIPAGKTVILDVSATVRSITVMGNLVWDDRDGLELKANWIMVHGPGSFRIGAEGQPFTKKAIVTLTGNESNENVMGMGTKFLGTMMGGKIELHGAPKTSWTKLTATAEPGATQITVLNAQGWQAGDHIVIAPTDFDPLEAEEGTIVAVQGTTVTLDRPLTYRHWGRVQTLGTTGATLDQRAEVANLTRSITIRGANAAGSTFGGHLMFMDGSVTRMSNIEVTGMGQLGKLGRYPVHWHIMNDTGKGSYLKNSAVHSNFQRGVVVHRTNDLVIEDNVVYNSFGHLVFLESSTEVRNIFARNLVMLARPVPLNGRNPELEFEHVDARISGFWISNSYNRFVDNVVVGLVHGIGYWFADGAISFRRDTDLCRDGRVNPDGGCHLGPSDSFLQIRAASPLLEFRNNTAHTIRSDAAWGETHHTAAVAVGLFFERMSFAQNTVPVAYDFRAWKITNAAAWPIEAFDRGVPQAQRTPVIANMVAADNRSAVFAAEKVGPIGVRGAVLYGMTDNQPPGVNAATRNYEALFKSFGAHNDDLEVTVLSLYPVILASSNNLTVAEVLAQRRLDGTNEPRFTEFSNVKIQGWPK